MKISNQAQILASLFPPNTSYCLYRPLDIITCVLNGKDRQVRTSFLQNLCGTSYLANRYRNSCHFCSSKISTLRHYLFDCQEIEAERKLFFKEISKHIAKTSSHLSSYWRESRAGENRRNICSILFGGNYVAENDNKFILFRKSHRSSSHVTDRTVLMTAKFLAKLQDRLEESQDKNSPYCFPAAQKIGGQFEPSQWAPPSPSRGKCAWAPFELDMWAPFEHH